MNKQGFIKTVEAIIAILIIFIFIYYITPKSTSNKEIDEVKELQEEILKGISENEGFRECIVKETGTIQVTGITGLASCDNNIKTNMKLFVDSSLTPKFRNNYQLVICAQGSCGSPPEQDTVYTSAVIVTSSLKSKDYNPKIVRLYLW